jgi:hypothetical protein
MTSTLVTRMLWKASEAGHSRMPGKIRSPRKRPPDRSKYVTVAKAG